MALSEEDRLHATELLAISENTLRIRETQIEKFGDDTAPYITLDAESLRRKIVALKAVLEPELPDEISGLVKRRLEDDYFIFQQTLGAKQDVALLREDVAIVKQSQSLAATWRMQADDRLERIETRVESSEHKRAAGAVLYRAGLLIAILAGLLAFVLGVALALRVLA